MKLSYGFIETRGYVGAIEAADAMVKAAKVELVKWRRVGGSLVMVVVRGELGACQAAVNAGSAAAERVGELITAHVIAHPFDDTQQLVEQWIATGKGKPPTAAAKPARRRKKQKKAPAAPAQPPDQLILNFLIAAPQGATLQELSDKFKLPATDLRLLLKHLMDEQKVEKIRHRYFATKQKRRK